MKLNKELAWPAAFVLLWSTGFVGIRYGAPYAPPFIFIAVRMLLAVVILSVAVLAIQRRFTFTTRAIAQSALVGLLLHGAYLGGCFYAVERGTPAGIVALIVSIQPILVAFAGALFFHERFTSRIIVGLFLGLAGVAIVIAPRLASGATDSLSTAGVIACAIAALGGASGTIAQKRLGQGLYPLESALYQYCATGLATYLISLTLHEKSIQWSGTFVAALLWLVLALSIGAILILFSLLKKGSASSVSSLYYLVPPTTAIMGFALFDERLTFTLMVGMAVAITGVYLVMKKPER